MTTIGIPRRDGQGFSLVIDDPFAARPEWRIGENWRSSNFVNGSPGFVDAGLDADILRINEVLAFTDGAEQIELINTTGSNLDLGGWYLSNDPAELTKFQLAPGTILTGLGRTAFSSTEHFGEAFTLDDGGGTVILSSPDAIGDVAGFTVVQPYPATPLNESSGTVIRGDGLEAFFRQVTPSIGSENVGPWISSVVVSELVYAPQIGDEFVELHNRSETDVDLFSASDPTQTWALRGAVDYALPEGLTIPARGYLVLVGTDPVAFRDGQQRSCRSDCRWAVRRSVGRSR